VFLTDLARDLAKEVGLNPPTEVYRLEKLESDTFDPQKPGEYIKKQIEEYGV